MASRSSAVSSFAREQIDRLALSGWNRCDSIRAGLKTARLPVPTRAYLEAAVSDALWTRAHRATVALRDQFKGARFAEQAVFGVLLVPDPSKLDTRGAISPAIRRDQVEGADLVDERLPAGKQGIGPGADWTLVATVTGSAGLSMGSYDDVLGAPRDGYVVEDVDTRALMIRQIWGARVLQCGSEPPDCEERERWTFTLFPGEKRVAGSVPSGTVLHGRVRFRLGKSDRGIASARVCPAIIVGPP